MSIPGSASPLFLASTAAAGAYEIPRSLRFNSADSAYLSKNFSSAGNRKTWSLSFWTKRCFNSSFYQSYFINRDSAGYNLRINDPATSPTFYLAFASGVAFTSTAVYRDFSAWMHVVIVYDSTDSTSADRVRLYINGERQTFSSGTYPSLNLDSEFNNSGNYGIGYFNSNTALDAYLADYQFVDGQALAASDFGEYDDNNVWQPKKFAGTYGTNGFHLDFSDNSSNAALGTDSSPNGNTWTVNNLVGVPANNSSGVDNISNIGQITDSGSNVTTNIANLNTLMSSSTFQDADTDNTSDNIRVSTGTKKFGIKWNGLTGLTGISVRWQRSSSYDPDVRTSGTGITTSTTTLQSSRVQTTFSTTSTTGEILFEDVTSGNTNGFTFRCIEFKGYSGTVNYPADAQNFNSPGASLDALRDSPSQIADQTDTGVGGEVVSNYATWNPLQNGVPASPGVFSEGNLLFYGNVWDITHATIGGLTTGKWYYEMTLVNNPYSQTITHLYQVVGWTSNPNSTTTQGSTDWLGFEDTGWYRNFGAQTNSSTAMTAGGVLGIAVDLDANTFDIRYNNVSRASGTIGGAAGRPMYPFHMSYNQSYGKMSANFGQRAFAYTAPSGYKCLCVSNLSEPTIADGSTLFDTKLWTGNGTSQTISGFNMSPDLAWVKLRSTSGDNILQDTFRGTGVYLRSNSPHVQQSSTNHITAFNSDGFSVGSSNTVNQGSNTLVAWAWSAGDDSSKTYAVTVSNPGSGNKYYVDGALQPTLTLAEGSTFKFDQSSATNGSHPLRFSTTSDGTHGGGSEYTTGVTTSGTPGNAGAYTQIVIAASAPTLYAYCSNHSGMGFQVNTSDAQGATNLDGDTPSQVKSNSYFSIVKAPLSSTTTIGHGLNSLPGLVIAKCASKYSQWLIQFPSLMNAATSLYFSNSAVVSANFWSTITNTTLRINANNQVGGTEDWIFYCHSPVANHSAIGSYLGNGDNDGSFVYTGFAVKWLLTKATSHGSDWQIWDTSRQPYNVNANTLTPNSNAAESGAAGYAVDLLSNGFKFRMYGSSSNQSGYTYAWVAFASNPFKTSRAK